MFFLCAILFIFFVYSIVQFIPSCLVIDKVFSKQTKINTNNNVAILKKLDYYSVNTNATKTSFIMECVNYLLYSRNPNYTEVYDFSFDDFNLDIEDIEKIYSEFNDNCAKNKKYYWDCTVSEITNFIKKCDIYKKLEQELNYKFKRSIILSKFINESTCNKLIDSLTLRELELLECTTNL